MKRPTFIEGVWVAIMDLCANLGSEQTKDSGSESETQARRETEDGQKKSKLEVVANNVQFLPSSRDGSPSGRSEGSPAPKPASTDDGDVPF